MGQSTDSSFLSYVENEFDRKASEARANGDSYFPEEPLATFPIVGKEESLLFSDVLDFSQSLAASIPLSLTSKVANDFVKNFMPSPEQIPLLASQKSLGEILTSAIKGQYTKSQFLEEFFGPIAEISPAMKALAKSAAIFGVVTAAFEVASSDDPYRELSKQLVSNGFAIIGYSVAATFLFAGAPIAAVIIPSLVVGALAGLVGGYIVDRLLDSDFSLADISELIDDAFGFIDAAWDEIGTAGLDMLGAVQDKISEISDLAQEKILGSPNIFGGGIESIQEYLSPINATIGERPPLFGGDPLVIDLNSDGVDLVPLEGSEIAFDFLGDGVARRMGWVGPDDGFLAHDLNGDGRISDVSELLGSPYGLSYLLSTIQQDFDESTGFAALALLDSNGDGRITKLDAVWGELAIWRDADSDGFTDDGELLTLDDAGIFSIDLAGVQHLISGNWPAVSSVQIEGHWISHSSTVTMTDATTVEIVDAWLNTDLVSTEYARDYVLDLRTLFLPTLRGYGGLPDLHIAMSLDSGDGGLLDQIFDLTRTTSFGDMFNDFASIRAEVESILYAWAKIDPQAILNAPDYSAHGVYGMMPEYHFVRTLMGQNNDYLGTWLDLTGWLPQVSDGVGAISAAFDNLLDAFTARLAFQIAGSALFAPGVTYNPFIDAFEGSFSLSAEAVSELSEIAAQHSDREGFWNTVARFVDNTAGTETLDAADVALLDAAVLASTGGALGWVDILEILTSRRQTADDDGETLLGTRWDDELIGGNGDDTLIGGDGNDTLVGSLTEGPAGASNDVLIGGLGDDLYIDGFGNDVFQYDFGNDVISMIESGGWDYLESLDIIRFGAGIAPEDVSFHLMEVFNNTPNGEFNVIRVAGRGTISIQDISNFPDDFHFIDELHFENGTVIDFHTFFATYHGDRHDNSFGVSTSVRWQTLGDIAVYGYAGDDQIATNEHPGAAAFIDAGDGDDHVHTGGAVTTVLLGAGNDTLKGGSGDLTVFDGGGDEDITLGAGDDVYHYSGGDDLIRSGGGGQNIVVLPEGVRFEDLGFYRVGHEYGSSNINDLRIEVLGLGSITVLQQFVGSAQGIVQALQLADGTLIQLADQTFITTGTDGDDTFSGGYGWPSDDDIYLFGSGQDRIGDPGGDDIIRFGPGVSLDDLSIYIRPYEDRDVNFGRGTHLTIEDRSGATLTVQLYDYLPWTYQVEQLSFFDGSSVTIASELEIDVRGTDANEDLLEVNRDATPNDVMFGFGGNDDLFGEAGDDALYGGAGDDWLYGGEGFDDAVFEGVFANYTLTVSSFTLVEDLVGSDGKDGVVDVERLIFADGIFENGAFLAINPLLGTTRSDVLHGSQSADVLIGRFGDDTLIGGQGDDRLEGGLGDDVYVYRAGDGQDTISDAGGSDTLRLGGGLKASEAVFSRLGDDLHITFDTHVSDGVTVLGYYSEAGAQFLERIEFFDDDGSPADLPPLLVNLGGTTQEDAAFIFSPSTLGALDDHASPSELRFTLEGGPAHGQLLRDGLLLHASDTFTAEDVAAGLVSYRPLFDWSGQDEFAFALTDGAHVISGVTFSMRVTPSNDLPYTAPDAFNVRYEKRFIGNVLADNGYGRDGDIDGDVLSIEATTLATTNGASVQLFANGDFLYTAPTGFSGADAFSYTLLDGQGGASVEAVSITVGSNPHYIVGGPEPDALAGSPKADTIEGGGGDDTINGGGGDDVLFGGAGNDVFVFAADSGLDRIEDFTPGEDVIEFTAPEVQFDTLIAEATEQGSRVIAGGTRIELLGISVGALGSASFRFVQVEEPDPEPDDPPPVDDPVPEDEPPTGDDPVPEDPDPDDVPSEDEPLEEGDPTPSDPTGDEDPETPADDPSSPDEPVEPTPPVADPPRNDQPTANADEGDDTPSDPTPADPPVDVPPEAEEPDVGMVWRGSGLRDSATGTTLGDRMYGMGGDDRMWGGAGDDFLHGGEGADRLFGQAGFDRLVGGQGSDTAMGGGGDDTLAGGGGDDMIKGQAGGDLLKGGSGLDVLVGGGGDDLLRGGGGRDTLLGARGDDTLIGGGGGDTFRFAPGHGDDEIRGFQHGRDVIEILRGANDFDDLELRQVGDDAVISFRNVTITVLNDDIGRFDADSFVF